MGIVNLLDLAKSTDAKILQASTSEVYGNPTEHPQKESYWGNVNPIGIRSCYDEGKRAAESLCMDYKRQYGVNVEIARIFNTYGPRIAANDGRIISNFIIQALKNKDLTVYGDGTQTRSFCYVNDLIRGFVKLMNHCCLGTPVNLGNPEEFSVLDVANLIIEYTCSKSNIIFKSLPEDDPVRRKPDISFANQELNWRPWVHFKEGIRQTIDYFRNDVL